MLDHVINRMTSNVVPPKSMLGRRPSHSGHVSLLRLGRESDVGTERLPTVPLGEEKKRTVAAPDIKNTSFTSEETFRSSLSVVRKLCR
jgi:uncharacterized protein related to proFAR isomerase